MSFDVNPTNNNQPVIKKSASTQDGGAGNLGYFQNGKKEKEEHQKSLDKSVFEQKEDSFERKIEEDESEPFSFPRLIAKIIFFFKNIFSK